MRQVIVPGRRQPHPTAGAHPEVGDWIATVRVSSARSDGADREEIDLPDAHLIEIELENGLVLWRRLDTLEDEMSVSRSVRPDGSVVLPTRLHYGPAGRSATGFMVRLFRFFATEKVARSAAEAAAKRIEGHLIAPGALLHCPTLDAPRPVAHDIPGETDLLILLHGTGSSTVGSFGDLAHSAPDRADPGVSATRWEALRHRFTGADGRTHIYGLEHRTLTESPVENAIRLLEHLPRGARLHLLSHSRGGLVGEILARATRIDGADAFDETDLRLLALARNDAPDLLATERARLDRLNALLREKQPEIGNFVRVACPARGTVLASNRLDLYLSVFANLVRLVPGPHRAFFEPFRAFVRAVVASRTDAAVFPGLEAMMPEGPLVAMLNRPDVTVRAPLMVVGGDVQPEGLFRAIATLATDIFFREDHDIVVNTAAMLGGARREAGETASLFLDRGGDVTHFSCFSNRRTAERIVGTLTGEDAPGQTHRLTVGAALDEDIYARGAGAGPPDDGRPIVFLLPGVMGSHLEASGRRVWMDPVEIALGGLDEIGCDGQGRLAPGAAPCGVLDVYYSGLARHLARQHNVRVFPYDWRRSVTEAADRLAETIQDALGATEGAEVPIRIVAHSMGGLVARSFIARHRTLWERMIGDRPGSRVLMLGTPNGGSTAMAAGLIGRDRMIRRLAMLDFKNSLARVIGTVMPMPGLLELLPTGADLALYDAAAWDAFKPVAPTGWQPPRAAWLCAARTTHEALRDALRRYPRDTEHMFQIAGSADATLTAMEVEGERLRLYATTRGDGCVTSRSGHLPGLRTWFAEGTEHGDLARDPALFPAIADILLHGDTHRLAEVPRDRDAGSERIFEMPEALMIYPAPDEVTLVAMGGRAEVLSRAAATEDREVRVEVRHGDLRYEAGTIAVGHYENAPLVSAERALDIALDGRLSRHRDLGLYPGALKTSSVFFRDRPDVGPDAALVVGLGAFGQISRESLSGTMARAMLRFALRWREQSEAADGTPCRLTSLVIGQRDGRLTIADSLRAILDALAHCNDRLAPEERIRTLTLLDLFEDKAVEALEALRGMAAQSELPEGVTVAHKLGAGRGGRRRHGAAAPDDWEHKIAIGIDHDRPSVMRFESLHSATVAEQHELTIDRDRVDRRLRHGTASPTADADLGRLLFEWMIPRRMKPVVSDGRNLTLILDADAAAYPWELIEDTWLNAKEPVGVRANMLRQLRNSLHPDRPLVSASRRVLVVGDPASDFAELPAAAREARDVAGLFRDHGWPDADLRCLTGETGAKIGAELSLHENQIVHFAGHGVRDHGEDRVSGLVLGPGDILKPSYVRNLRRIPQFVFLNCCHVGATRNAGVDDDAPALRRDRAGLAASLAVEFVRSGSAAVIAAGWEIDDTAAATFSRRFYERFLGGAPFGEAVRAARRATWSGHPDTNTWGAYQCYGDPQFRLRRGVGGLRPRQRPQSFVAASQAIYALEALTFEAGSVRSAADLRAVSAAFDALVAGLCGIPGWKADARLLEALGRAAAELGAFERAIGYFEQAAASGPARFSAAMLADLCELRIRVADDGARETVIREAVDTLKSLTDLPGLGAGPRARARIGDCHLRLAAELSDQPDRRGDYIEALGAARSVYGDEAASAALGHRTQAAHARMREAFAAYLLALDGHAERGSDIDELIRSVVTMIADVESETGSAADAFDTRRLIAEAALFRAVVEDLGDPSGPGVALPTAQERETLLVRFNTAFLSGSSVRGRRETVDDLRTTARLLAPHREDVASMIRGIADDLDVYPSLLTG